MNTKKFVESYFAESSDKKSVKESGNYSWVDVDELNDDGFYFGEHGEGVKLENDNVTVYLTISDDEMKPWVMQTYFTAVANDGGKSIEAYSRRPQEDKINAFASKFSEGTTFEDIKKMCGEIGFDWDDWSEY